MIDLSQCLLLVPADLIVLINHCLDVAETLCLPLLNLARQFSTTVGPHVLGIHHLKRCWHSLVSIVQQSLCICISLQLWVETAHVEVDQQPDEVS